MAWMAWMSILVNELVHHGPSASPAAYVVVGLATRPTDAVPSPPGGSGSRAAASRRRYPPKPDVPLLIPFSEMPFTRAAPVQHLERKQR